MERENDIAECCNACIKAQGCGGMSTGEIAGAVVGSVWVAMCICVCVWKYRRDGTYCKQDTHTWEQCRNRTQDHQLKKDVGSLHVLLNEQNRLLTKVVKKKVEIKEVQGKRIQFFTQKYKYK